MTMTPSIFITFAIAAFSLIDCSQKQSKFEEDAAWVQEHRSELNDLADKIKKQDSLRRIIWSDGRKFITVVYRDGRIVDGYADETKWDPEITQWLECLRFAGCHGFDDGGPEDVTSIYLDTSLYIAIPNGIRFSEEYHEWAKRDRTKDGYRCTDLGRGWYLTTEKH